MKEIFVSAGIIQKDGKILCMQRNEGKHEYVSFKWEFPGGKIESGESPEEALIRELKEELDMDVQIQEHFVDIRHQYPDLIVNMSCFLCTTTGDNFKLNVHKNFKWLEVSKLHTLDWAGADIPVMNKLVSFCKKCVLVTGAYGGMGKATVDKLKKRGILFLRLTKK